MKTDLFQSCGHCWVSQVCWHIECSTFTASSFRIWNRSTGIPSLPLALFVVMLPKTHLTSHSRMSGSRWVITSSWLPGSWSGCTVLEQMWGDTPRQGQKEKPQKDGVSVSVSHSVMPDSLQPQGLQPTRLLCPWDFPGKNTGVGRHFLLQGIFPIQGSNPGLLHCRQILYWLSYKMVGGAKSHLESNPIPTRDAQRTQTNLVCTGTHRPHRDCVWVSPVEVQSTVDCLGAGALDAADLSIA